MIGSLSFRASISLVAVAYAVIAGVLVAGAGVDLARAVADCPPQVSWLMPETTGVRIAALNAAGRAETAALYALVVALSWGLIGALSAGGFAWGVLNKGDPVLGLDKTITYVAALSGLYALATGLSFAMAAVHLEQPRGGLNAMPGLWFATMILSAAILARVVAMIAHDAGALFAIAVDAEPRRLAELVTTVEAMRGAESLEARLARRIARRGS